MATAAALTLPLWLGSCAPGPVPPAASTAPAGATVIEPTEPAAGPLVPVPQPQEPPPATAPAEAGTASAGPSTAPSGPRGETSEPGRGAAQAPATGAAPGTTPAPGVTSPSPTPEAPAPPPAAPQPEPLTGQPAGTQTVTAYYVLLDDGGAGGVRFGCNDSLAGVRRSVAGSAEPLAGAVGALLDGSAVPAEGLYNSLSDSVLTFLSGSFDGTTVTVYLSGTLRPGGVCDIPRIEAQLTQTAVASVGAIRAEVYVNGVGLTEALSLK